MPTHGQTQSSGALTGARVVRASRGTAIRCKGWQQEAALRMLMNNLDPEVAEAPDELVVYGGAGKAARDWASFDAIVVLALAGDAHELLDGQRPAVQDDGHNVSFHSGPGAGGAGACADSQNEAFRRQDPSNTPLGMVMAEHEDREWRRVTSVRRSDRRRSSRPSAAAARAGRRTGFRPAHPLLGRGAAG